jgi:hypothetical protein
MTEPHQPGNSEPGSFEDLKRHLGRLDYCPTCGEAISVPTGPEAERAFEIRWEQHKATHKPEETQGSPIEGPDGAQLQSANERAKEASRALEQTFKNEGDHLRDLEKHFDGVSRIERRLPQLIDFSFKLANAVGNWAKEKDYRTKALKLGTIYWTPAGDIAAEFTFDKFDLSAPDNPEYLKRGYARLPKLNELYPAVFELCMTLGEHLVNICDQRKVDKKDISFTNLHVFSNPNTGTDFWAFKILNRKQILKAHRVQF